MKKLLTFTLVLMLCFALFACTTSEPTNAGDTSYDSMAEVDPWYGEYPEGFVPLETFGDSLWTIRFSPEDLVEWADLILIGTIIDRQFEWHFNGTEREAIHPSYDPVTVYTVVVSEVLKTNIEVGETLEFRVRANYRDIVLSSSVPAPLNIGEKYLLALATFEDMFDDYRFVNDQRALIPSFINPEQFAYSLETNQPNNTIVATHEGVVGTREQNPLAETVFTASEILALFE